jgi:hypothetical protein
MTARTKLRAISYAAVFHRVLTAPLVALLLLPVATPVAPSDVPAEDRASFAVIGALLGIPREG